MLKNLSSNYEQISKMSYFSRNEYPAPRDQNISNINLKLISKNKGMLSKLIQNFDSSFFDQLISFDQKVHSFPKQQQFEKKVLPKISQQIEISQQNQDSQKPTSIQIFEKCYQTEKIQQFPNLSSIPKSQRIESNSTDFSSSNDSEQNTNRNIYKRFGNELNLNDNKDTSNLSKSQNQFPKTFSDLYDLDQDYLSKSFEFSSLPDYQDANEQFPKKLTITDFQEIELLGEGIYGKVYLARHVKSNFLVALKKISKNLLQNQDSLYLSRQIKIQSSINHPNIVQLYTFFDDQQNIYLVLQICKQGNLYSMLLKEGGRLPEEKVLKFIKQISHAIKYLHENQIIHRDLKPENILIHNGVAKICDFGWAINQPLITNSLCGTPLYSSPEIVKHQFYDNKIDIWNIGILTYQLIYGSIPFDIKNYSDLYKITENEISFPENIEASNACKYFISNCLQKNPSNRPDIFQLLNFEFLQNEQKFRQSLGQYLGNSRK